MSKPQGTSTGTQGLLLLALQGLVALVERDGIEQPLEFSIAPEVNASTQFRQIGIQPPFSTTLTPST